jgi:hypothetical protein
MQNPLLQRCEALGKARLERLREYRDHLRARADLFDCQVSLVSGVKRAAEGATSLP